MATLFCSEASLLRSSLSLFQTIFLQVKRFVAFFSQVGTNTTSLNNQESLSEKDLSKIINTLGQEVQSDLNNLLFYIYDDGTVEKRIIIEE